MWLIRKEVESNGRIIKLRFDDEETTLSFRVVLQLLRDNADFRSYFMDQLVAAPFEAYRWETPAVTASTFDRSFECVILDSPGLDRAPDANAFAQYFESHAKNEVAVFPNLGNDAVMIVPCPVSPASAYGHLAAFLRNAPIQQRHSFWQQVGKTTIERIGNQPIWLNTAGAGVAWLHVRLDSRPKYYHYSPYK